MPRGVPPRLDDPDRLAAGTGDVSAPPFESEAPSPGTVLCGRYRLEAVLARGATAQLYRATDELLGETVAVKVLLLDGLLTKPEAKAARLGLKEEAVLTMRLTHPNILRVYNYEYQEPWELIVMELVPGEDLDGNRRRRADRRFSIQETLQVGLESLDALAYAHEKGVIHNDIKPSNILITRAGTTKVCDFGLARVAAVQERALNGQTSVLGSPPFMSPERVLRRACDARSDIYSLGATLWTLATGSYPFGSDDGALMRHVHSPLPPAPELPTSLDGLLRIALAKRPEDRFPSARAMLDALAAVFEALGPADREPPAWSRLAARSSPPIVDLDLDACEISIELDADAERTDARRPSDVDRSRMVRIGARTFQSLDGGQATVAPFYIDRAPVTNEEYGRFLAGTGTAPPAHWLGGRPPAGKADHPVVGVNLDECRSYAAWCGKRLPTALEWEASARGPKLTAFPWGDAWIAAKAVCLEAGSRGTAPVGALADGASPEGVVHLVGNVWEWTEPDGLSPADPDFAWVMGGSFRHACGASGRLPRTAVAVANAYEYLGFRCALDGEKL